MPKKPFQYYLIGFRDFMMTGDFEIMSEADAASGYLKLIERKLKDNPEWIVLIFSELAESIKYVGLNQDKYHAKKAIFGSFQDIHNNIMNMYEKLIK